MVEGSLGKEQKIQEEQYYFPYHYLDLVPHIEYTQMVLKRYRNFVLELLAPYNGQSVLDAGCGDGRLCYEMRKRNLKITGIDYSERAIAFARAFCPKVEFIVGDLTKYRFEKQFDAIVLMEVLEHFELSMIAKVLANLFLCLTEDGKLIITVPSEKMKLGAKHYQHFSVDKVRAALQPYFRIEAVYGFYRDGLRRRICSRLIAGDYVLGYLRTKTSIVRPYYWLTERLFASIERCPPEKGCLITAVCKKA